MRTNWVVQVGYDILFDMEKVNESELDIALYGAVAEVCERFGCEIIGDKFGEDGIAEQYREMSDEFMIADDEYVYKFWEERRAE